MQVLWPLLCRIRSLSMKRRLTSSSLPVTPLGTRSICTRKSSWRLQPISMGRVLGCLSLSTAPGITSPASQTNWFRSQVSTEPATSRALKIQAIEFSCMPFQQVIFKTIKACLCYEKLGLSSSTLKLLNVQKQLYKTIQSSFLKSCQTRWCTKTLYRSQIRHQQLC